MPKDAKHIIAMQYGEIYFIKEHVYVWLIQSYFIVNEYHGGAHVLFFSFVIFQNQCSLKCVIHTLDVVD